MPHIEEGTIHAWLDGALPPDESRRVDEHVAQCVACAAVVAEARGLIAASSRILASLDDVPGGVFPGRTAEADALGALRARKVAERAPRRRRWWADPRFAAAAAITFIAATATLVARQGGVPVPDAARETTERAPAPVPPALSGPEVTPVPSVEATGDPRSRAGQPVGSGAGARSQVADAPAHQERSVPREADSVSRVSAKASGAPGATTDAAGRPAAPRAPATPLPVPAPQQARSAADARQEAAMQQQQAAAPRQQSIPPAPAATLGMEPARLAPRASEIRRQTDTLPVARRAEAQLRNFAVTSARQENLAFRAKEPPALALEFVPLCYQLSPVSLSTSRPGTIPERVLLDSTVAGTEDGIIWFRARDLSVAPSSGDPSPGDQSPRELLWRPVGSALVELRADAALAGAAANEPARDVREWRVLFAVPGVTAESRAAVAPPPTMVAARISCPR